MGAGDLKFFASDLESSGLLYYMKEQGDAKKLHNFASIEIKDSKFENVIVHHPHTEPKRKALADAISDVNSVFIIHNGYTFDLHALELFDFDTSNMNVVDTLPLSWYLHQNRDIHGLEKWGEDLGVEKPKVTDWENLTQEEYDHRVVEDCKIQRLLWMKLCNDFADIYGCSSQQEVYAHPVFKFLQFKGKQLREQYGVKWKLDVEACTALQEELSVKLVERSKMLAEVMPDVPKYTERKAPKELYKLNGEMSEAGKRWAKVCEDMNIPLDYSGKVKVVTGHNPANPNSVPQVKAWLEDLGWIPETFEYKRESDGTTRKIPQVNKKNSGGLVCESVERLIEDNPSVGALKGLGIVKHRLSLCNGWLENHEYGYISAEAAGFTNTLRLKHRNLVNIPSGRVPYGKELRACLLARDGHTLTGSDLSSLENRWKFHYQFPLDPDYVREQMTDDFDPHLSLCVVGGLLTANEMNFYKIVESKSTISEDCFNDDLQAMLDRNAAEPDWGVSEIKRIGKVRGAGKATNYACLPMDTKIFTPSGIKGFDELEVGDSVFSYSLESLGLVGDKILHKHFYKDAKVFTIKSEKSDEFGDFEMVRCTLNHRWLTVDGEYKTTQELLKNPEYIRKGVAAISDVFVNGRIEDVVVEDVYCLTTKNSNFVIYDRGVSRITGNCQYGAGVETIARTAKVTMAVARKLKSGYDKSNYTIPIIAAAQKVKAFSTGKYLWNKVSKIWYPLKAEKDRFSTLIQGSGAYTLDLWLLMIFKLRDQYIADGRLTKMDLLGQFHDECIFETLDEEAYLAPEIISKAMDMVNDTLKLNVKLGCDIKQGKNYYEIH